LTDGVSMITIESAMSAPCPTFGFIVHLEPRADVDRARIIRAFMHEAVEDRGLRCAGLGARSLEYLIAGDAMQATDADRRAVLDWLGARNELSTFSVGPLVDVGSAA
jgi:uncharacterized protein YggL (DUF469 family)